MSPAAARILARAEAAGVELEPRGDRLRWRSPGGLPPDLLAALKAHKAEVLEALTRPEGALPAPWVERLRAARDWQDLSRIIDDGQQAFVDGALSGSEVERVARQCLLLSRRLPEHRPPPAACRENPAADMLPPDAPPDTCHACRHTEWWTDRYGARHCRVCHPPAPGAEQ